MSAPSLVEELQPILDEETEVFVLKLYRMIIYEVLKAEHKQKQK